MLKKILRRLLVRPFNETSNIQDAGQASNSRNEEQDSGSYFVLSYSNVNDCRLWGLQPAAYTPWNWASNWVLSMARPKSGDCLLDLGCIDNPYVIDYCKKHAIDTCFIDIAQKPADFELPENIQFVQSNLNHALPFQDNSFDVILSESSLEHLPTSGRLYAFQEAIRCLRPGGRLAVSLGLPLGFSNDAATIHAFESHDFFTRRHCSVFFPIDIKKIIDSIRSCVPGNLACPYNHTNFPGFDGYSEEYILQDRNIILDRYQEHAAVPDIARLRCVSVVEIGLFFYKSIRQV